MHRRWPRGTQVWNTTELYYLQTPDRNSGPLSSYNTDPVFPQTYLLYRRTMMSWDGWQNPSALWFSVGKKTRWSSDILDIRLSLMNDRSQNYKAMSFFKAPITSSLTRRQTVGSTVSHVFCLPIHCVSVTSSSKKVREERIEKAANKDGRWHHTPVVPALGRQSSCLGNLVCSKPAWVA